MSTYRESALVPVSEVVTHGLVRANGSRCTCTPPGFLWRWWFKVQWHDRWYCVHGGGWRFGLGYPFDRWLEIEPETPEES